MKKTVLFSTLATLFLAACAGNAAPEQGRHHHRHGHHHHHGHAHGHHHGHQHGQQQAAERQQFACRNGMTVTIAQHDEENITLSTDTDTGRAALRIAPSGSGERYVSNQGLYGKTTEWHVKNGEASFTFTDPYNNKVETTCRAK